MNKYILIIFFLIGHVLTAQNRSKYSNEFLNIGVDAKSIGMGMRYLQPWMMLMQPIGTPQG